MLGELLGKQKEPVVLPDVQEQSQCSVAGAELKEGQTSPPKSYTEDTLLSAMERAGADDLLLSTIPTSLTPFPRRELVTWLRCWQRRELARRLALADTEACDG